MTELQRAYDDKADRALAAAHLLLGEGDVEACLNRAYYAVFYVATAALLGVGEQPKSHSGTHARFRVHFIQTGAVDEPVGKLLTQAFTVRQRADYDAISVFDTNAAADALADAEAFVAAVRPLIP